MKHGEKTRLHILNTALTLWPDVNAHAIARAAGLNSHSNVLYHFKTLEALRTAIAEHAVKTGYSRVIVQLLADSHPATVPLTKKQRAEHWAATIS